MRWGSMIDKICIWDRANALMLVNELLAGFKSLLSDGREDRAYHLLATLVPIINAETIENNIYCWSAGRCSLLCRDRLR